MHFLFFIDLRPTSTIYPSGQWQGKNGFVNVLEVEETDQCLD